MKKRIISLILTVVMFITTVFATVPPVHVSAATTPTVFLQEGEEWSDHPYGHKDGMAHTSSSSCNSSSDTDIGYSGCGILAYVNAIYYLNGNFIDPIELADYAISNGHRVCTVGTAASLYSGFAGVYGTTYGFEYGNYYDTDFATMQSHLTAGGVAVANVPGHFIAIVDYDADSEKYLVLDSYPTTTRGTTANGDWKTKSELSSGKLSVNYFMTFTSVEENSAETNPTTTFNTTAETYTIGDTYKLTGSVTGSEADLKAVQVSLYGPDKKTSGIVLYRWEGASSSVSLEDIVEFRWGDVVYRDDSLQSGTESLDTNMPGTYWIQVYATDVNGNGFASEKCKTVTVKNKSTAVTNWNEEYNPNYNGKITPELIKEFLESYPSGGLYQTELSNGQTVLSIDGTEYDLGFDSYYSHSNTITDSNPLSELSTARNKTPAEIIYYACVENDMNVVWILANLQKEQSLIESVDSEYQTRLNRAVGYMKFTEGTRSHYEEGEKFYGFVGQTVAATYQFWSYATAGKTAEQAYETYTPSSESGNMLFDDFKTDIYDEYAEWFDENMSDSETDTPTYLDTPVITSPSTEDTYAEGDSITFSWNAVDGADYYEIGVKDITSGITLTAETLGSESDDDNRLEDTFCTLDGSYVLDGHELKFAVGAGNNDGLLSADWSSVTITVETTSLPEVTYYTITYDANGGTDAPSADTKLEDVGINLNGAGPVRDGYTCIGWSTDPDAAEAEYALGEVYDINADITLYAVWRADTVVEPDADYGTVINSGTCGDNLTWAMYDSGTLVISGDGDMTTLGTAEYPWYTYRLKITKVVFKDGVTSIAENAFNNYDLLKEITFNDNITSIGSYAFLDCDALTNIEISDSVTSIGGYAFQKCDALANVYMGKSVTSIGQSAFEYCTALTSITIPDALTDVGRYAINQTTIRKVIVPESVVSIHIDIRNFGSITSFVADNEDKIGYYTVDGILYHYNEYTDVTTLVRCPESKTIRSFTIPEEVNVIGQSAFQYNDSLKEIIFNDNLTSIGSYAFLDCDALTNIEISDSVTSIGGYAFQNCDALASVYMGKSVTSIGQDAFENCTKLSSVYFYGNAPTSMGYRAFNNISSSAVFYYIEGTTGWTNPWNGYTTATFVPEDTPVAVTGVTLSKSEAAMNVGSILTLTATVTPADATDSSVTWISSDTAVAKVSGGKVTAVGAGTAVITATTTDGGYAAACTVTVEETEIPEGVPVITVSDVTGRAGKTVDVTINISGNTGITGAVLRVNYDSALTLTNVTAGDAFTSLTLAELATPYLNPLVLSWDGDGNDTSNGTLVTLTFEIPEGMETGDYPIVIAYDTDDIYDTNLNDVAIAVVNGHITVTDIVYGDYNNDGKINGKDLTLIRRYISGGFDLSGYDAKAADVNNDGKVNGKDLTIIRRYISGGFDIVLGQ